ncbi:hypothetical protein [Parablautia muri]|nr:hypothetical protein [Parablautia muri]
MIILLVFGLWVCHILIGLIFIVPGLVVLYQSRLVVSALKAYLPDPYADQELKPLTFDDEENDAAHHNSSNQASDEN